MERNVNMLDKQIEVVKMQMWKEPNLPTISTKS